MRRYAVPAGVVAAAIIFLIVLAVGINHSGPNNSIAYTVQSGHYKVPPNDDAKLPTVSGASQKSETLADYRGKLVLVNYFASWCVPCQMEAPVLRQAQKLLSAHNGTVLGIGFQQTQSQALGYLRKYGLSYPAVRDPDSDVAGSWGITGVPDSYLIDPQGKIVWLNTYQLTQSFVAKTLPQLIAKYSE